MLMFFFVMCFAESLSTSITILIRNQIFTMVEEILKLLINQDNPVFLFWKMEKIGVLFLSFKQDFSVQKCLKKWQKKNPVIWSSFDSPAIPPKNPPRINNITIYVYLRYFSKKSRKLSFSGPDPENIKKCDILKNFIFFFDFQYVQYFGGSGIGSNELQPEIFSSTQNKNNHSSHGYT